MDERNARIATKTSGSDCYCTIIGNTPIPLNTVTLWSIKALSRMWDGIFIGVAPFGIDRNTCNYNICGWYFHCCYSSTLRSGPPHNYNKGYGPMKEKGNMCTQETVWVL